MDIVDIDDSKFPTYASRKLLEEKVKPPAGWPKPKLSWSLRSLHFNFDSAAKVLRWSRGQRKRAPLAMILLFFFLMMFAHVRQLTPQTRRHDWIKEQVSASRIELSARAEKYAVGPLPWNNGQRPLEKSFAGYIDIRRHPDGWSTSNKAIASGQASTFFWFIPARSPKSSDPPMLVWLQGGPGASSMIGLFEEMGPWKIDNTTEKLNRNPDTWAADYSVLFIDNPVGTGFSYVVSKDGGGRLADGTTAVEADIAPGDLDWSLLKETDNRKSKLRQIQGNKEQASKPRYINGYAANQAAISRDIILLLDKFYDIFPETRQHPLYLTGESYAGKYIPHLASAIDCYNRDVLKDSPKIPLEGIAIGDGLTDPATQIKYYAALALAFGLVNRTQGAQIADYADLAIAYAGKKKWFEAGQTRKLLFEYFSNVTGGINWYDIRKGSVRNNHNLLERFLLQREVRRSINVCINFTAEDPCDGDPERDPGFYHTEPSVPAYLVDDIMRSASDNVAALLNYGYRVLLYQGQFDYRDGILSQTEWIDAMKWKGAKGYRGAERKIWRIDNQVAGYITEHEELTRVELLMAGHLAPGDQGRWTQDMIKNFISGYETKDRQSITIKPAMRRQS